MGGCRIACKRTSCRRSSISDNVPTGLKLERISAWWIRRLGRAGGGGNSALIYARRRGSVESLRGLRVAGKWNIICRRRCLSESVFWSRNMQCDRGPVVRTYGGRNAKATHCGLGSYMRRARGRGPRHITPSDSFGRHYATRRCSRCEWGWWFASTQSWHCRSCIVLRGPGDKLGHLAIPWEGNTCLVCD